METYMGKLMSYSNWLKAQRSKVRHDLNRVWCDLDAR